MFFLVLRSTSFVYSGEVEPATLQSMRACMAGAESLCKTRIVVLEIKHLLIQNVVAGTPIPFHLPNIV